MINILVCGPQGGSYEMIAKVLANAMPDSNIKYMDSFETAYSYMDYHECLCVYTSWEADRQMLIGADYQQQSGSGGWPEWHIALPGKYWPAWLYYGFNSFVTTNGSTIEDLTVFNPDKKITVGAYDTPARLNEVADLLQLLGIKEFNITPYSCFTEMKKALQARDEVDFIYGNSVNLYKRIGAVEVLTSREADDTEFWLPEKGVPWIGDYTEHFGRYPNCQFGYISQNIDPAIVLEHLTNARDWNDDDVLDRGYVRSTTLDSIIGERANRNLKEKFDKSIELDK